MSDYAGHERPGDTIPHQDDVEDVVVAASAGVVDAQLIATSDHAAIADVAVPSATYVEAEAVATVAAVNGILDVLRDAGLIPTS